MIVRLLLLVLKMPVRKSPSPLARNRGERENESPSVSCALKLGHLDAGGSPVRHEPKHDRMNAASAPCREVFEHVRRIPQRVNVSAARSLDCFFGMSKTSRNLFDSASS